MGFLASDIEGFVIKRAIVDELGGLEVICRLVVEDPDYSFKKTPDHLESQRWNKQICV